MITKKTGSVAVKKKIHPTPTWSNLIDRGEVIPYYKGRPNIALLNANNFNYGIANLGAQTIAQYLLYHEMNVYFAFSDTMNKRPFLNDKSNIAPRDCDVVAISVPFEDTYLNALRLLEQSNFPIFSKDRDHTYPLVVAGGLSMINPIPFSDFFDICVIGEGREALREIAQRCWQLKERNVSKQDILYRMADIPGVYIPSHYKIGLNDNGYVDEFVTCNGVENVEANLPLDMKEFPIYSVWTSKYASYEQQDYFSIMSALGCHKKCPFCVVGHVQVDRSGRAITMDEEDILQLALERRNKYGTNLIKIFFSSAFSPGEGDINSSALKSLLLLMNTHGFSCRVGSLNVKQADEELFELLKAVGQDEVTFAPETTEDMRLRIGKMYISDEKLHQLAGYAKKHNFSMNIYSLGSLPGEHSDVTLTYTKLLRSLNQKLGPNNQMFVHYNPAFMKAQTPHQYFGNTRPTEIRQKYALLRSELEDTDIEFVSVIPDPMTYYQCVLALGDFNSGKVLSKLYKKHNVTEADWINAFRSLGFDDNRYFMAKDPNLTLPWEHVSYTSHQKLKHRAKVSMRSIDIPILN